jgi:hypothetical protein
MCQSVNSIWAASRPVHHQADGVVRAGFAFMLQAFHAGDDSVQGVTLFAQLN